jgi:hypothetical protein
MTNNRFFDPIELPDGREDRVSPRLVRRLSNHPRKLLARGYDLHDGTMVLGDGRKVTFEPMGDIYIAETPELKRAMKLIQEADLIVNNYINNDPNKHVQADLVASKMAYFLKYLKGLAVSPK